MILLFYSLTFLFICLFCFIVWFPPCLQVIEKNPNSVLMFFSVFFIPYTICKQERKTELRESTVTADAWSCLPCVSWFTTAFNERWEHTLSPKRVSIGKQLSIYFKKWTKSSYPTGFIILYSVLWGRKWCCYWQVLPKADFLEKPEK